MTAASRGKLKAQADKGSRGAKAAMEVMEDNERMIGALLLGNNIANIGASALATGIFTAWFGEVGVLYATGVMTVMVVIFAEVLPGVSASPLQVFVGIAVFVILNAALGLWSAGRGRGVDSVLLSFVIRLTVNFGLVGLVQLVRSRTVEDYAIDVTSAIFFVFLFSVLITLYDRYRPVYDYRRANAPVA